MKHKKNDKQKLVQMDPCNKRKSYLVLKQVKLHNIMEKDFVETRQCTLKNFQIFIFLYAHRTQKDRYIDRQRERERIQCLLLQDYKTVLDFPK